MRLPWITITRTGTAVLLIAATFASTSGPRAEAQAVQQAPAKTPASAFAFIAATVGDGSWTGDAEYGEYCGRYGCGKGRSVVTGVYYLAGTYCKIQFKMRYDGVPAKTVTRTINLAAALEIGYGSWIGFAGPVVITNGTTEPNWYLYGPSHEIQERVTSALNYLQEQCAPKSPW